MTHDEFDLQMERLLDQWPSGYGKSRTLLIWKETQNLTAKQFASVVDRLLGESDRLPLLPAFREAVAIERERGYRQEAIQRGTRAEMEYGDINSEEARKNREKIKKILADAMKSINDLEVPNEN